MNDNRESFDIVVIDSGSNDGYWLSYRDFSFADKCLESI